MKISKDIVYVGVNDHKIDLFEGQYKVENGMAYNSYVVLDDKIAVMDTVDADFTDEWLENVGKAVKGRNPDYLVVQHMEPDHSAGIKVFLAKYPEATVVSSAQSFTMMKNFYGIDAGDKKMTVSDGSALVLGAHALHFIAAPMVHWPEVVVTYDFKDKVLFSADGFGKFGALDVEEEWACEARRYYFGIVGKYGLPVQNLLKKASSLDIAAICPLHGPVLSENLAYYLSLYNTWSAYASEDKGVVIAYTSVYGNTKKAAELLKEKLEDKKVKVQITDLARDDMAEAVEDAFRYDRIVFATTTYNGDIFPFMRTFMENLVERNFSNKTVAFIENGSWAPQAARIMRRLLEACKNLKFADTSVRIMSALNEDAEKALDQLANELS